MPDTPTAEKEMTDPIKEAAPALPVRRVSTASTRSPRRSLFVKTQSRRRSVLATALNLVVPRAEVDEDEDEEVAAICGGFRQVRDSTTVQERRRSTNDGEAHDRRASVASLKAVLGTAVGGGVVEGTTAVHPAEFTPARRASAFAPQSGVTAEEPRQSTSSTASSVRFTSVTVREYTMTLGDHPEVRRGHPVALGWEYDEYKPVPVDQFEVNHPMRRPLARLRISPEKRLEYLRNQCGVPWCDLKAARQEIVRTQKRRKKIEEEATRPPGQGVDPSCCVVS